MSAPLLVAEGIHRIYAMGRGGLHVLRGCNLAVQTGEFVAIMGKSGSGKSTLLHILGALDVPQTGQVFFRQAPVFAPPQRRWFGATALDVLSPFERRRNALRRSQFGFVFQFYHLLPELNVLENVLLARMVGASTFAWPKARRAARGRFGGDHRARRADAAHENTTQMSFRAANASASRSPGRWCTGRRSCSPTNRPATWMRSRAPA